MMNAIARFYRDETAANTAEYGLLLAMVSGGVLVGGAILKSGIESFLQHAADFLDRQSFPNN